MNEFLLKKYKCMVGMPFKQTQQDLQAMLDDLGFDWQAQELSKKLFQSIARKIINNPNKDYPNILPLKIGINHGQNLKLEEIKQLKLIGANGLRLSKTYQFDAVLCVLPMIVRAIHNSASKEELANFLVKKWKMSHIPFYFVDDPNLIESKELLKRMNVALTGVKSQLQFEKVIHEKKVNSDQNQQLNKRHTSSIEIYYASYVMRCIERGLITEWEKPFAVKLLKPKRSTMLREYMKHKDPDGWAKYANLGNSQSIWRQLSLQVYAGYVITKLIPTKISKIKSEIKEGIRYVKWLHWLEDDAPKARGSRAVINDKRIVRLLSTTSQGPIIKNIKLLASSGGEPIFLKLWASMPNQQASIAELAISYGKTQAGARQKDPLQSVAYYVKRAIKRLDAEVVSEVPKTKECK